MKKILSLILCLVFITSTVACTRPGQAQNGGEDADKLYEAKKELYGDIVSEYTSLIYAKHRGEEIIAPDTSSMDGRERAITEAIYGIVSSRKDEKALKAIGYGYRDVDGNGTPELFLMTKNLSILALFTLSGEKPVLLETGYDIFSRRIMYASGGRFLTAVFSENEEKNQEVTSSVCRVSGDRLVYDSLYGQVYDPESKTTVEYFEIVDGTRVIIDEEKFEDLDYEYDYASTDMSYSYSIKPEAPLVYLPLATKTSQDTLPVADFSSYEGVRKTYNLIVSQTVDFKLSEWAAGEYDGLFSFPSDIAFEYYTRLLRVICYTSDEKLRLGYDGIDLNGDGTDELVLLSEDYRIKAIFTQKDGVPVMLGEFPYETCWIDDRGALHVDREDYYELEYSLYDFKKDGAFDLVYSILVAKNGKRYLTKNGKTDILDFEESLTLYYDDYCRYEAPFAPNEQTRNVSDIDYTPLLADETDAFRDGTGKTWKKYADHENTVDDSFNAYANTYVSFENVTDASADAILRYTVTEPYPDPNNEHTLLSKNSESTLNFTLTKNGDVFSFSSDGIAGHFEFKTQCVWLIVEQSTDERFPAGHYCLTEHTDE